MEDNIIIKITKEEVFYLINAITSSSLPTKRNLVNLLNRLKNIEK